MAENYEAYTSMVRLRDKVYFVTYVCRDGKIKIVNVDDITEQIFFYDVGGPEVVE